MYKTVSGFSGSVILRNRPLKFPIPIVLDVTDIDKLQKMYNFGGKMVENLSEITRR